MQTIFPLRKYSFVFFQYALLLLLFNGCQTGSTLTDNARTPSSVTDPTDPYNAFRIAAPGRVVAIGDIHGDLDAAEKALRLAGAIDDKNHWIGGNLVVVQTGDQIDRWDDDRAVLDLFSRLQSEAEANGGRLISLNGNHELMNVESLFWVVKPESFKAFLDIQVPSGWKPPSFFQDFMPNPNYVVGINHLQSVNPSDPGVYQRAYAFSPGSYYAKVLGERPMFIIVNDTVFVHGGITPEFLNSDLLKSIDETKQWMLGKIHLDIETLMSKKRGGELSPVDRILTDRTYSAQPLSQQTCDSLAEVLTSLRVKRMVIGHTIQKTMNSACHGGVWRIDVALSRGLVDSQHKISVLEIKKNNVGVLQETRVVENDARVNSSFAKLGKMYRGDHVIWSGTVKRKGLLGIGHRVVQKMNYLTAERFCQDLGGGARLPTREEYEVLAREMGAPLYYDRNSALDMMSHFFWSSTVNPFHPDYAYGFNGNKGTIDGELRSKREAVRCVVELR